MSCYKTLKSKGLRLTPQRRLIIDMIHSNGEHITAEEIINHVQLKMPGINKSTIYRTLEVLEQAGCVFKSTAEDGFIYHHAEEGHHHHLICVKCGKSEDCDENLFTGVESFIAGKYGYQVHFQHMLMQGFCSNCRSKSA